MFGLVDKGLGKVYGSVGNIAGLVIGLFAVSITVDLLLRNFGLPVISGLQEIIEYALYVSVFLSAPWVLRLGAHIRVDLLAGVLGPRWSRVLDIALNLKGLGVCLILVYFGMCNLMDAYQYGTAQRQVFIVMEWHLLIVFVLSFFLCALEFAFRISRGSSGSEEETAP